MMHHLMKHKVTTQTKHTINFVYYSRAYPVDSSFVRLAAFDNVSRQLLISSENFQVSIFN
jgi:hypothetical protein